MLRMATELTCTRSLSLVRLHVYVYFALPLLGHALLASLLCLTVTGCGMEDWLVFAVNAWDVCSTLVKPPHPPLA